MDIFLSICAVLFGFLAIAGSILPFLPGPQLGFLGLLFLHRTAAHDVSGRFFLIMALLIVASIVIDYFIPIRGTKKFGGTKGGARGATIGVIVGLFIGPRGIILGPFIGAFIGERLTHKDKKKAFRAAKGSLIGFLFGTGLKLVLSGYMLRYIIAQLIR